MLQGKGENEIRLLPQTAKKINKDAKNEDAKKKSENKNEDANSWRTM